MISKTKNTASIRQPNTGRILGTAALALAAVLVSGAGVKASTVIVTPSNFASSGWSVQDVRSGGTSTFSSAQPRDGNGSYELSLAVSLTDNSKATLFHPGGDGLALSDFIAGSNNLGFEYYRDGTSTANTIDAPAFRLYFGTGKPQLVWEASYNGITSSTPVPLNS